MAFENIKDYVKELNNKYVQGHATEHTYRPALEKLIKSYNVEAINEPGGIAFGKPDFEVKKDGNTFGFIEAKDIPVDLDEDTEQFKRYINALDNLIYTNYIEFRLYINKKSVKDVQIAKKRNNKIEIINDNIEELNDLIKIFAEQNIIKIGKSDELAEKLAFNAHLIEEIILKAIKSDDNTPDIKELKNQYQSFQENLILGLEEKDFASMFAQTVCYGLFAAWVNMKCNYNKFSTKDAFDYLPETTPFLKAFFNLISIGKFKKTIGSIIDNVSNILANCDKSAVLNHFGTFNNGEDPIIHFYQTFLLKFDKDYKDQYGAYYTPKPVVEYIVKSIDYVLIKDFNQSKGLASRDKTKTDEYKVQILDPATGTGTFVSSVIDLIYEHYRQEPAFWKAYVKDCLLDRLHAFEFMMAPYTITHMQIDNQLKNTGINLSEILEKENKRLKVFLCDTLQKPSDTYAQTIFGDLIEEIKASDEVKRDNPIMVILGNPPYSVSSANNNNKYIVKEVKDNYYPKGERKLNLQDDYVKFFRFAQMKIDKTGYGILGFITNNGYLDNPTFRQMRKSLMESFNQIYILNLHGNALKNETCPDGSEDNNVFDIRVGVSICIMIKNNSNEKFVKYADLYGKRNYKFEYLLEKESIKNTEFIDIEPQKPFYLFVPKNNDLMNEYNSFMSVKDIMKTYVNGIETQRDKLTIDMNKDILFDRIKDIKNLSKSQILSKYDLTKSDWIDNCKEKLIINKSEIKIITYRPFDNRYIYYSDSGLIARRRFDVMKHMLKDNIGFIISRKGNTSGNKIRNIILSTRHIMCEDIFSPKGFIFPFYKYDKFMDEEEKIEPNLSQEFINKIKNKTSLEYNENKENENEFNSMDVFNYIYGLLSAKEYREKYIECIDIDFPRVPAPKNSDLFFKIGEIGSELIELHLIKQDYDSPDIKFRGDGNNKVEKIEFIINENILKINNTQYFTGVTQEIYDINFGGYEVLDKYLSYRKKKILNSDEITTIKNIIYILGKTIELTEKLSEYANKQIY